MPQIATGKGDQNALAITQNAEPVTRQVRIHLTVLPVMLAN
jgi:hypothetical protein